MKLLGLTLFTLFLVQGQAELQCYQCKNCEKIQDSSVGVCVALTPSTSSPTTSPTTSSPTDSPTSPTTSSTTSAPTEPTEPSTEPTAPPEVEKRKVFPSRIKRALRADGDWSCFYERLKDEKNATVVNRGCTQKEDYCKDTVEGNECKLCFKDKCNSSVPIKLSLITLLLTSIMILSVFK